MLLARLPAPPCLGAEMGARLTGLNGPFTMSRACLAHRTDAMALRNLGNVMRIAIVTLASALSLAAAPAAATPAKLYPVLFEVEHNAKGQLVKFELNRVIDPASGKPDPVKLTVPQSFIDGARARSLQAKEAGKPDRYFTYYIFDPARPTDLYIEKY